MTSLEDRLRALVKIAGSQRKFAKVVGFTNVAVLGWLRGAEPYDSTISDIAEKSGVSPAWLRDGKGDAETELENFRRRLSTLPKGEKSILRGDPPHDVRGTGGLIVRRIPIISMAQAGALTSWEDVDDYEGVEAFAVRDPRAIAVRIRGDSMAPDYKEGTVAILYPSVPPRTDNLVVAKLTDGSVLFKRLHISGDKYHFLSLNPAYPPIVVTADQIERILTVGKTERDEL